MPAPDVYDEGHIDPFTDSHPIDLIPYEGILYATDRKPAGEEDKERFYLNQRGHVLRLGVGRMEIGEENITWEEARKISLLKNRADTYPLKIVDAEEIGILDRTMGLFMDPELIPAEPHKPAQQFASWINEKLAIAKRKDIYVYVHGFKVVFENPLLVGAELWHFLGYDGVFIAYAWPSTPSNLAYVSDLETAVYSARNFSRFLKYLADETEVERIHIIGYSAGTRVVINGLARLALERIKEDRKTIQQELRIGNVILVGSDFDRNIFGAYLDDGLLNVTGTFTIYMSERDKALGISKWLFRRQRLGQISGKAVIRPYVAEYLRNTENLIIINVSGAEGATSGNGHAYFRQSPWVSSDILMTLMYGLSPEERGVVHDRDTPIWKFPDDYIERLRTSLAEINPDLSIPVKK
jgi:esterase/lipase superfamily enzyme